MLAPLEFSSRIILQPSNESVDVLQATRKDREMRQGFGTVDECAHGMARCVALPAVHREHSHQAGVQVFHLPTVVLEGGEQVLLKFGMKRVERCLDKALCLLRELRLSLNAFLAFVTVQSIFCHSCRTADGRVGGLAPSRWAFTAAAR